MSSRVERFVLPKSHLIAIAVEDNSEQCPRWLPWVGKEPMEEVAFVSGLGRQGGCGSAERRSTSLVTLSTESTELKP